MTKICTEKEIDTICKDLKQGKVVGFPTETVYGLAILADSKKAFDELKLNKIPSIKSLNSEYATLLSDKNAAYGEYVKLQKEVREMLLHKQNYEYILGIETDKNEKGERYHSREK